MPPGRVQLLSPDAKRDLENELAAISNRARQIATALNRDNLAVVLPDDILLDIFKRHVAFWTKKNEHRLEELRRQGLGFSSSKLAFRWMAIIGVCARWRAVALGAPVLWTNIHVIKRTESVKAFVERSQAMPISVSGSLTFLHYGDTTLVDAWSLIFGNASRIEALSLDYAANPLPHAMPTNPFGELLFPKLRSLDLNTSYPETPEALQLPPVLRRVRQNSRLESLKTACMPFSLASALFAPTLRALVLTEFGWVPDGQWSTLFDALKALPCLEDLRLIDGLPRVSEELVPESSTHPPLLLASPVPLPKLRKLQGNSYEERGGAQMAVLARNLSFPTTTVLFFSFYGSEHGGVHDLRLLGSVLNAQLADAAVAATPRYLRTLQLEKGDSGLETGGIHCNGWSEPPFVNGVQRRPTPPSPMFDVFVMDTPDPVVVDGLLRWLPLHALQALVLDELPVSTTDPGPLVPTEQFWRDTLGKADDLRVLSVVGMSAYALINALRPPRDSQDVLFPNLEEVKLCNISYICEPPNNQGHVPAGDADVPTWLASFVRALVERQYIQPKRRLRKLVFYKCAVFEDAIGFIRSYVDEVVWIKDDEE